MISPTGSCRVSAGSNSRRGGFTLIELILVMTLIVIAFGIIYPSLSGHFRGRLLDSEARRLLALTRYGQSRAVAEGVPMALWVDTRQRAYGLEALASYTEKDEKAVEFELGEDLWLEASAPPVTTSAIASSRQRGRPLQSAGTVLRRTSAEQTGVSVIRLQPDGFIGETSPEYVVLRQGDSNAVWLVQNTNRCSYEIQVTPPEKTLF